MSAIPCSVPKQTNKQTNKSIFTQSHVNPSPGLSGIPDRQCRSQPPLRQHDTELQQLNIPELSPASPFSSRLYQTAVKRPRPHTQHLPLSTVRCLTEPQGPAQALLRPAPALPSPRTGTVLTSAPGLLSSVLPANRLRAPGLLTPWQHPGMVQRCPSAATAIRALHQSKHKITATAKTPIPPRR